MTAEPIRRARTGDRDAFAALVDPYRAGLQAHCYRMLGSLQDSEDLLQETLLAAWLGLDGFEGRASVRTWLYRIASNRCLNQLRSVQRRPAPAARLPASVPEPTRPGEVFWLQPYPDSLLDGLSDQPRDPRRGTSPGRPSPWPSSPPSSCCRPTSAPCCCCATCWAEAIRRGALYRDAGADCVYPIGVRAGEDVAALVTGLGCPVNANTGDHLDLAALRGLGVARVSYGPRFYRAALAGFGTAVREVASNAAAAAHAPSPGR